MNGKFEDAIVEYESGATTVKLSPGIIRRYLVSGNGKVTDEEIVMFLNLCKAQRLNPFLREAYLIKYGGSPATMIVGKDVFTKRASKRPEYAGFEAGVVVRDERGAVSHREGSLVLHGEEVVGGWAKVHLKDYAVPITDVVSFSEYCQMKDGRPAAAWARMPATMIRKVALVHALREAFPEDLQGLYDASEMRVDEMGLDSSPVALDEAATHSPANGEGNGNGDA